MGEVNFQCAALLLVVGQTAALFAQIFLAGGDVGLLGVLASKQFGGLGVDLLAFVPERFDLATGNLDFGLGAGLAFEEGGNFRAALLDNPLVPFGGRDR